MKVETENDFSGIDGDHPMSQQFNILTYSLGGAVQFRLDFFATGGTRNRKAALFI